jgi:hypothetical protein
MYMSKTKLTKQPKQTRRALPTPPSFPLPYLILRPPHNTYTTPKKQMTMDNTAPYPLLNPTLLSRIRSIVAVRPQGLAMLVTVLHINSFCALYGLTALGVRMGNIPEAWRTACQGTNECGEV